jgi:hypothetical protein
LELAGHLHEPQTKKKRFACEADELLRYVAQQYRKEAIKDGIDLGSEVCLIAACIALEANGDAVVYELEGGLSWKCSEKLAAHFRD